MKRRIFALLTALCMIWTLLPAPALAAEEPHSSGYVSGCLTNPLYDHDGCSGVHGHLSAPRTYADGEESLSPEDYLTDPQAVYAAIRTGLEQRQATITVPWRISAEGIPSEPVEEQQAALGARMLEALAMAMVHTGVPTQGDYLQWHYQEVLYGANYATDGTYYYLDMSYEATYYTTAAQEAELTAALEPVMASFGFTAGTDDYTKVKAIYDYVCANVTYDYANLEDETYTLKFTAYAAMMNGTSVCQGYATLLYRMLLAAGVDNRVIVGTSGTENHAWNIVKLGDVWYNADSTWDAGQTAYGYFLKAPANFPDHTRSAEYETADFHAAYPMATADYVPEEVHTHTVTPVAAEPATCTEPGTKAHYVCSCGKLFSDAEATVEVQAADLVIDATGHTVTPVAAEPATCTEPGTEAHYVCSCGKLFSDAEATVEVQAADLVIDATGHTVTPVAAEPATCTEPGTEAHYVCSCGKLFSDAEATVEVQAADLVIDATGHTVTPVAAEPATCTEPGTEAHYLCSCGKLFSDAEATVEVQAADLVIDATGHTVTPVAAEPATCTEPGTEAHYVCSCGKLFSDAEATVEVQAADLVIDATGHTVTPVAAEPATCTEPGTEAHYVCSCGKLFSDAEATVEVQAADLVIPVTDHTWGDWVQTTPPTEDEKGEETRECSVCHTTETQDVDALGHICKNHLTAKDAVDPTCTEPGIKAHYLCSCGKIYEDAAAAVELTAADLVIPKTGHTEETIPAVPATCKATGLTEGTKCSVCGEVLVEQTETPKLDHTWGAWGQTTAPTETDKGEDSRVCSACGETETREVPALGHLCQNHLTAQQAKPASCTEPGTKAHYLCSCGKIYEDAAAAVELTAADLVIPKTGHTEETIPAVPATCKETGLTEGTKCSVCGEVLVAQTETPKLDHTWGAWGQTTAPTETDKGEDTRVCSACGETETREVPALGHLCQNHLTAQQAKPASCTEDGTKAHYLCSCGKIYEDAAAAVELTAADLVIAKTGHTEEVIPAVPATCKATGLTEGTKCSVCGETLVAQQTVPAKGHSYVNGTCSVCGGEDPGFIAGDFTGDNEVTDEDAIYLLWHTLFPEKYPLASYGSGDLTGDGLITDEDAIYLLWHTLFPEKYPLYAPAPAAASTTSDEKGKKK